MCGIKQAHLQLKKSKKSIWENQRYYPACFIYFTIGQAHAPLHVYSACLVIYLILISTHSSLRKMASVKKFFRMIINTIVYSFGKHAWNEVLWEDIILTNIPECIQPFIQFSAAVIPQYLSWQFKLCLSSYHKDAKFTLPTYRKGFKIK